SRRTATTTTWSTPERRRSRAAPSRCPTGASGRCKTSSDRSDLSEDALRVSSEHFEARAGAEHAALAYVTHRIRRVLDLQAAAPDAHRLSELQLDHERAAARRLRARHVDGHEVAAERALVRAIEPELRASLEQLAREGPLVVLEGERMEGEE